MGLITGTIVICDEIQTTGCRGLWGSHRSDTLWLHGTHLSGPLSASNWCLYPFKIGATIHPNNNSHLSIYLLKAEIYFCLAASLSSVSPLRGPQGAQVCDDQDDVIWLRVHDIRDSHESLVTSSSHIHRNICLPLSNYPPPPEPRCRHVSGSPCHVSRDQLRTWHADIESKIFPDVTTPSHLSAIDTHQFDSPRQCQNYSSGSGIILMLMAAR